MNKDKLPKILISGYYGFNNTGDEAILLAMLRNLPSPLEVGGCTVLSGSPENTELTYDVASVHFLNFRKIVRAMRECDIFVSGGGSLLQDVTSRRSLFYYLGLITLAKALGKKVMLYAQGIGPIRGDWMRRLTARVLEKVDLLTVRDEGSLKFLRNVLGIPERKIHLTADVVFLLPRVQLQDGKVLLKRIGFTLEKEIVGVAVRSWGGDRYFEALVAALDALGASGKEICLIPFQYPTDLVIARRLKESLHCRAEILEQVCTTEEMLSVVGNLHSLIGMRLHSLIFAAVMQVPFVALEYDPKVKNFVETVGGVSLGTMDEVTREKILQGLEEALDRRVDLSPLQELAGENNKLLQSLAEGSEALC